MNPYLNRVMIQNPRHFYGRRRELSRIFSRIGVERPQSVSVVGERRIGKSSLLFQLSVPEVRGKYLPDNSSLIVIFLDFQQMRNITLEDFFAALSTQIRRADPKIAGPESTGYRAFQQVQERLSEQNRQLVLLFDEFDAITLNPVFDRDFYAFLRSVANNSAVAYVTSSKTEIQRLCHSTAVADSPFFNIFSTLRLRPFDSAEAHELIAVPSREAGIPLEPYTEDILTLSGQFPFYIQIACSVYHDWLEENPGSEPIRPEIESRFLEEAGPHFEYFWGQSQPEYQHVMRTLIAGEQPRREEVDICRSLIREGYVIEEGQRFRMFSNMFSNHIRDLNTPSAARVKSNDATLSLSGQEFAVDSRINQYQILRRVQEGGMGLVYQAKDLSLGRKVALKVVRPSLVQMENTRKRFLQEARLAAALTHPAITSIYELFEFEDQVVLAMEWLEGETLREKVLQEGPQEWRQLASWLIEACSGLETAHRQGIIHRDIKSSNLMITKDNHLKILDFGLAKQSLMEDSPTLTTDLSIQGTILGTIDYMSPEQACGQVADHRSDLFSLGIVAFECLTGQLPFRRSNSSSTIQAIINEPIPDLELYRVAQAEGFNRILQKLLAKQPERRYAGAAQVEKELAALVHRRKSLFSWHRQK